MASGLVLRDVQVPPTPPWWPPAPGWWLLAVLLVAVMAAWLGLGRRRARRRMQALRWFDAQMESAATPVERLARSSELLRRAARGVRADADRLQGEDWLAFLDLGDGAFVNGEGRLLLDGPFRADVDAERAEAAVALARTRFAALERRR